MALKKKKESKQLNTENKTDLSAAEAEDLTPATTKKATKKQKQEVLTDKKAEKTEKTNKKNKNAAEEVKPIRIKRIKADYKNGLTSDQVADRNAKGLNNITPNTNVKTYKSIFVENIFTFFNMLCFAIFISLAVVGA